MATDLFAPGGVKRRRGVDLLTPGGKRRKVSSRAKQKTKQRAASLKKKRSAKLDRDPLYNPQAQLSGRALARAALDLTRLEFDPQENLLKEEGADVERQGGAQQSRTRQIYTDLARREAGTIARQKALADLTSGNLGKLSAETQAAMKSAGVEGDKRAAEDESLRGAGLEGGGRAQAADERAAQQSRAAAGAQAFRSAAELQSGGYQGLAAANAQARQTRGAESGREISNRILNALAENRSRRRELGEKRSAAKTKHLLDLRQTGFENIATVQGLGLKEADIAADADKAKRDRSLARSRIKETRRTNKSRSKEADRRLSESERHNVVTEGQGQQRLDKKSKGKGKFTATQRRGARRTFDRALVLAQQTGDKRKGAGSRIASYLVTRHNIPPALAKAASEKYIYGRVWANTIRRAKKEEGVNLGPAYKRRPRDNRTL